MRGRTLSTTLLFNPPNLPGSFSNRDRLETVWEIKEYPNVEKQCCTTRIITCVWMTRVTSTYYATNDDYYFTSLEFRPFEVPRSADSWFRIRPDSDPSFCPIYRAHEFFQGHKHLRLIAFLSHYADAPCYSRTIVQNGVEPNSTLVHCLTLGMYP